ncbi:MAG: molybdate ABC transporter substrate-binding protein [Beijerinckiaceae bacterium]
MSELRILSGGAAHGLVKALANSFAQQTGYAIKGDFGAVGIMRDRLFQGERPDIIILTAAILRELAEAGIVDGTTIRDVGTVATAIAVRARDPVPGTGNPESLRAALLAADAIYFPDPKQATAGIHFQKVLMDLGIFGNVKDRLRTFPNGATAMQALAQAPEARPIGCTQATEIITIDGLRLVGDLPPPHDLATIYTAGVIMGSTARNAACDLVTALTSVQSAELRKQKAFR